jgi:hypothetical protein
MRYLNASQAAKYIGVADKTIRRWLKPDKDGKIKLTAIRTASNQLAIPELEVERLKRELEQERSQFMVSGQGLDNLDITGHSEGLEIRIAELEKEVVTLKERIAILEQGNINEQAIEVPVSSSPSSDTLPLARAQKRNVERNIDVPSIFPAGTLSASNFATRHGVKYEDFKNYMRRGIYGEKLDITEIPHPTRAGYVQKFLTLEQQEQAIALLKKHGKLPISDNTDAQ